MAKVADRQNVDWRDRTHEIVWEDSLLSSGRLWITKANLELTDAIERVIADGVGLRMRHSDHYDAYTFSLSYPKDAKEHKSLTFWYYWGELEDGIKLAAWTHQEFLPGWKPTSGKLDRQTSW